ncbi:unnamed protein product [Brachionus calyciflorus]|uniref:Uncharacterized protein n=1 Tax=Brachionus calyciflorus TaxID=104777 RepID=A0A813NY82_9BILA|nr:unnamed protein product [Brachionus calyciflorus]
MSSFSREGLQHMLTTAVTAAVQEAIASGILPGPNQQQAPSSTSRIGLALKFENMNFAKMVKYIIANRATAKHLTPHDQHDIDFLLIMWDQIDQVNVGAQSAIRERVLLLYYVVLQGWHAAMHALKIAKTESNGLPPMMPQYSLPSSNNRRCT